jgi:hypothetical protein
MKIIGKPFNASLQVLKRQIYDNTVSVPPRNGGDAHDHLGIVFDTVKYLVVSDTIPCRTPRHPGGRPNLAPGTTDVLRRLVPCQLDTDLVAFEIQHRTSNAFSKSCFYL